MKKNLLAILVIVMCYGAHAQKRKTIDTKATQQTKALFKNMMKLSKRHTMFGHQHATEYGHGWSGEANRSDVKSVTGSHPAVIGVDFSGFSGVPEDVARKSKEENRRVVTDMYNRGGVT